MIDDVLGVTEAGINAHKMNAFLNVKSAEKTLQFGPTKCKTMLIGKNTQNVVETDLVVDTWKVEYLDNPVTGEADLVETYSGQMPIKKTDEQKYLGFVLSSKGDNMANIRQIRNKSIGTVRKIFNRLNSLKLKQYYFECAVILMNSMLRPSILYACEMYYNLKESELRHLERIEESFLRKVMNTTRGCPITQLYLEMGHIPARFEIQKMRLLYLKYILEENEESLLRKFLELQMEEPIKGDWASTCFQDLQQLEISESLDEIKRMSKSKFTNMLKSRLRVNALKYLIEKQKSKGKEISYSELKMADYLLPYNSELTILEKQQVFRIRNRMIDIPSNFPKSNNKPLCVCGGESMEHIYNCGTLSEESEEREQYLKIFNGNFKQQVEVFRQFENIMRKREFIMEKTEPPCDPSEIRCSLLE